MNRWQKYFDRLKPSRRSAWQFFVFNIGGIAFFITGYGVFALLYGVFHWRWWQAKIIADLCGWTINYIIQRFWAFRHESKQIRERTLMQRFTFISLANVPLDYAIVGFLNSLGVTPFIGLWISSLFFTVWKYAWYKLWVFKK